jgi:hypothetical protein
VYSTGRDLGGAEGLVTLVTAATGPAPISDSTLAAVNSDSLDRVIAEMRADTTSSTAGLVVEPGDSFPPSLDTLSRAPLVTEGPKSIVPGGYRRTLPNPGYVRVSFSGGFAPVRIDGKTYGLTPQVIALDSGAHFVSLIGNAYTPSQIEVAVVPGDTVAAVFKVPATATKKPDSTTVPGPTGSVPPVIPPL